MRRPPPSRAYIDSTALLFSVALLFYPTPVTPECPDEAGSTYATVRKYAVGLHGQGLLQAAKGCHERSAELDKTRPEPWLSIGDILRQEGYLHEAEKSIRRCIKIAPSWHLARFNLGNTLKGLGRHEDAIEEYREAMKLDPPFKAAVLNNMAISHGALNHNDDVLKCYEEALVHDPSFPETYNNMASHLQAVGRLDDAIEAFKSAVGLRPDSGFMVNLAYALGMKGDTGSAIQVYARTTELHPNYPLAYYNLGTTLMGEERYSESEWSFRMAVSLDPKVADYHNNLATVVGASGARPEVLSLYATVLGLAPGHETAYSNLHHARRELCDWVGGEEGHLGKVLDIVDRQIAEGRTPTIRPFHALAYDVDVEWARKLAEVWSDQTMTEARRMVPPGFTFPLAKLVPDTRVRIAYTSSDIKKQHPVGHLVLSLFHLHDMMSHQVADQTMHAHTCTLMCLYCVICKAWVDALSHQAMQ
jgi:tetratricopeptide (TPR) repeat protein